MSLYSCTRLPGRTATGHTDSNLGRHCGYVRILAATAEDAKPFTRAGVLSYVVADRCQDGSRSLANSPDR
jgi:hypothetical protein